jgi:hypothetical protein
MFLGCCVISQHKSHAHSLLQLRIYYAVTRLYRYLYILPSSVLIRKVMRWKIIFIVHGLDFNASQFSFLHKSLSCSYTIAFLWLVKHSPPPPICSLLRCKRTKKKKEFATVLNHWPFTDSGFMYCFVSYIVSGQVDIRSYYHNVTYRQTLPFLHYVILLNTNLPVCMWI